jgi:hypothetical protein
MQKIPKLIIILVMITQIIKSQTVIEQIVINNELVSKHRLILNTEINSGLGLLTTDTDFSNHFFGLTSGFRYGITKDFQGGLGAGLSFYNGGLLVPVYIDLRYFLNIGKMSLYPFGDAGLLLNFPDSKWNEGLFVNPGIGVRRLISDKLAISLGFGLFVQKRPEDLRDSFINAKFGISFLFKRPRQLPAIP